MITRFRYIEFRSWGEFWICLALKPPCRLGTVEFNGQWKKWEFVPEAGTAYTPDCLRDIAAFIGQLRKP